jgi:hypothetical protein
MLGADVLHLFDGLQSLLNDLIAASPRPEVMPT